MNNRFWMITAGVACVAIFALGWFLGAAPKLAEMNAASEQRAAVEVQNRLYETKLAQLKKKFEQLDSLRAELKDAQALLPSGDDLSTFLGELHRLEASSGAVLTNFGAGDGEAYIAAPGSGTPNPLVTKENFIAIPINLSVTGTRAQVIDFLNDLQYGTRLFLVTKLTVAQDAQEAESYNGDISGLVYVLVDPSSPPPSPTPAEPVEAEPAP